MKQIIPEVSHIPFRNSTLILTIFFQLIMFHTDSSKRLNTIFIIKSKRKTKSYFSQIIWRTFYFESILKCHKYVKIEMYDSFIYITSIYKFSVI